MRWPFLRQKHRDKDHADVEAAVAESHVLLDIAVKAVKKADEKQSGIIAEYAAEDAQRLKNGHVGGGGKR